jgi:hypothetical protein
MGKGLYKYVQNVIMVETPSMCKKLSILITYRPDEKIVHHLSVREE